MIENGNRITYMNDSLPNHRQGMVEEFFAGLNSRVEKLPVWNDELYLQFHRGCYTSQAWIKKANRRSEILYHDTELFCALDSINNKAYPREDLKKGWELMLLNQFHDILPGSSIAEVYQDCRKEYQQISALAAENLEKALQNIGRGKTKKATKTEKKLAVFNSLSWSRSDLIQLPLPEKADRFALADAQGNPLAVQVTHDKTSLLAFIPDIPALGFRYCTQKKNENTAKVKSSIKISKNKLENKYFIVSLDKNGWIVSLFDKLNKREVIAPGAKANVLQAFEDRPLRNNAWDIDIYYQDKIIEIGDLQSVKILEQGPLRACLLQKRKFIDSEIEQRLYIYEHIPRIDFETVIDWQQNQTLLKVAFPVAVHANAATYEIPYGNIQRPTHWNTLWDMGRFEVPAQKWADLSEGDYGVSLLNDCKYGYDIRDNVLRLTLIKSPVEPDPQADIGQHIFTYSLYPHQGDWRSGGTIREAYRLNYQPIARLISVPEGEGSENTFSFVNVDVENVIIESVKKAEDTDEIVLRLYENANRRGEIELTFAHPLKGIWECNMLEKDRQVLKFKSNQVIVNVLPYEIKTLLVKFK
jgi:alpha-mannosidase